VSEEDPERDRATQVVVVVVEEEGEEEGRKVYSNLTQ